MAHKKTEAQIDRYNRYGSPLQWLGAAVVGSISSASTFINLVRTKFHDDSEFRQGFSILNEAKNKSLENLNDEQIERSMDVLKKYVGDHPSYQAFSTARYNLNDVAAKTAKLSVPNAGGDEVVEGASAAGAAKAPNQAAKGSASKAEEMRQAVTEYLETNKKFLEDCKDGIDKAMKSSEYKRLAIDSSVKLSKEKGYWDRLFDSYAEAMYGIKSIGIRGHVQGVWERFVGFGNYTKRNMLFKTAVAAGVGFGGTIMAFNQLNTRDKLNEIDKQSERVDRKIDALLKKAGVGEHEVETRAEHKAHERAREKQEDQAIKSGKYVNRLMESRAEAELSDEQARA